MQKFWYHSPVRFYKTKEELTDMTNPQNTQYFGGNNPYPLEIGVFHRFLIPNYQNEIDPETNLELWLVNDTEIEIPCEFGIANGKLFRITFISFEWLNGSFEIRTEGGDVLYYSNCISFIDSTDIKGRKHIRIATKHYYNRNLFEFDNSNYEWMVTNLPAYCLGQFLIDSEYETERNGNNNSLIASDSYLDEVVTYEFIGDGDSNIFSFIMAHVGNDTFFIDGTQRTIKEKPDVDEFSAIGTMKFVNIKDENGFNVTLDEDSIFEDSMKNALSNKGETYVYVYNTNYIIPTE